MKAVPLLSRNYKNFTIMKKDIEFEEKFDKKKEEAKRKAEFDKFCAEYRNEANEHRKNYTDGFLHIAYYANSCSQPITDYLDTHDCSSEELQELENLICEYLFPNAFE